ncbi:hypothetical protein [Absidia glauca]|uniref:GAR domain-containing protein n=1 Tax=Absidia glauca TaxID=4829 RepID=A0A163JKT5_ABSGL|nr:hypothetical protein [Absidia glauca]
MVRVGGGWTELSQFLRDHALIEGELVIPKQQNEQFRHTPIKEGYLNTALQRQESTLVQRGYKESAHYFAVDQHGNQLEVKMPRFRQSLLPTSTTNRRRKVVHTF